MIFQHIFAPIIDIIKHIFHKAYKYKSLNIITVNAQAIMHNFYTFQKHKPAYTIIPVLKSNAYGHGIKQICQIINTIPECKLIAVDSYPEYQIIHKRSNKSILIMAETHASNYVLFDYKRTHVALWNKSTVKTLGSLWMKVNVHIFVNTGMNREGIRLEGLEDLLQEVSNHPNIHIIWIMSHLACADDPRIPSIRFNQMHFIPRFRLLNHLDTIQNIFIWKRVEGW
jgi:alanine racemase